VHKFFSQEVIKVASTAGIKIQEDAETIKIRPTLLLDLRNALFFVLFSFIILVVSISLEGYNRLVVVAFCALGSVVTLTHALKNIGNSVRINRESITIRNGLDKYTFDLALGEPMTFKFKSMRYHAKQENSPGYFMRRIELFLDTVHGAYSILSFEMEETYSKQANETGKAIIAGLNRKIQIG
jgi:hypothetical protein